NLSESARATLEKRRRHFDAPYSAIEGHGDFELTFGWAHAQRRARLQQLAGEYDPAAAAYLRRRVFRVSFPIDVEPTAEMTDAHDGAAEDSFFWISAALVEEARKIENDPAAQLTLLSEATANLRGYI